MTSLLIGCQRGSAYFSGYVSAGPLEDPDLP
jgi:hypothetical protein